MLKIINEGEILEVTRGDSFALNVTLDQYTMQSGDVLVFSAKNDLYDRKPVFKVTSSNTTIYIDGASTKKLRPGARQYDIQLIKASGAVATIVGLTNCKTRNFIIYESVGA